MADGASRNATGDAGPGRKLTGRMPEPSIVSSAALPPRLQNDKPTSPKEAKKRLQPAVYWNDRKSTENQRTFFEDTTPPHTPSYAAESFNSASIGYPSAKDSTAKNPGYDYTYDHVAPPAPIPTRNKTGLKRWMIWAIVGAILLVLLALALGLGIGLSQNKGGSNHESDEKDGVAVRSSTSSITSTLISTSTTTTATKTSTSTESSAFKSTVCPAANNTEFDVPGSPKTFRRYCGIDYSGDDTEDLATVWTASVDDCIINCAGYDGCTACSWGVLPGDNYKDNHRCFLKTKLGKPNKVRAGWDFAILQ